ncbi:type II secretion system protein XpsI [Lysobacter silvisoli]|uniref:General secretion pathway protein GspI n=1 Tax=Lysobacter silvisoli TaxID=2293254 RepID=A0A371JZI1_9GAMM|nr:prepilin-type N-terminal cleavage/methylation domain-containing protein [Lysobacter silvisoli]RDZ27079.1 general secretion pathway protein GspI [Lysobacter silvisoli]
MSAAGLRRRAPRGPRAAAGYTLLEVIIAFALLAAALTLLLGTLSGASRQVRMSGEAGRAALHAQSLLDQVGVGQPLAPGQESGDFEDGRYRWTLGVRPWRDRAVAAARQPVDVNGPQLFEITLAVEWGEGGPGQRLLLRSLRTALAGPEAVMQ